MKWLIPILLLFAILTDTQGRAIYVAKSSVVAITSPAGCDASANSKVITTSGQLCTKETMEENRRKFEDANP